MPDFITVPLPADLPTDWEANDIVAPNGADVGLSEQHGYNYLMEQVNNAQTAISQTAQAVETETLQAVVQVTYNGGGN
jgi:hypothetical protein